MSIKVHAKEFTAAHQKTDRKIKMCFRPDSTDVPVLKEVLTACCYRKVRRGFDVFPGEHWLDLGANIGSFAAYCYLNGATADCYEPDPQCFTLLQRNIGPLNSTIQGKQKFDGSRFELHNTAVTNIHAPTLPFFKGTKDNDYYRTTIIKTRVGHPSGSLPNVHAINSIMKKSYDGIKMDIEGSEFGLIEDRLIPKCSKLCMEYHFSRDKGSMTNFHRRMNILREMFEVVTYSPTMDKPMINDKWYSSFDQFIYCFNRK